MTRRNSPVRKRGKEHSGRKYNSSNHTENAEPPHEKNFYGGKKGGQAGRQAFCCYLVMFFVNKRELLKTPMQFPALDGTALMVVQWTASRGSTA